MKEATPDDPGRAQGPGAPRRLRTALTALAIVLGVAHGQRGLHARPTRCAARPTRCRRAAYDGTDAVVTAQTAFAVDSRATDSIQPPDASTRRCSTEVRAVPQVAVAVGDITDEAKIIGDDGKPVGDGPYFGDGLRRPHAGRREAHAVPPAVRPLGDRAGRGRDRRRRPPRTQHYAVGDRDPHRRRAARPRAFRVVGIARFGTVKSLGTATIAVFDLDDRAEAVPQAGPLRLRSSSPAATGTSRAGRARVPSPPQLGDGARSRPPRRRTASRSTASSSSSGSSRSSCSSSAAWRSSSARSRSSTRSRSRSPSARASSRCCAWSAPRAARCSARCCSRRSPLGRRRVDRRPRARASGSPTGLNALFGALGLDLPEAGTVFAARTAIVGRCSSARS